jgi:hypothetical protein
VIIMGIVLVVGIVLAICVHYAQYLERKIKYRMAWPDWAFVLFAPWACFLLWKEARQLERPPTISHVTIDRTAFRRRKDQDPPES